MLPSLAGANVAWGNALSADGRVVTGTSTKLVGFVRPYRAVRWDGGVSDLGVTPGSGGAGSGTASDSYGVDLSADGSSMAGNCTFPSFGNRACRWTSAGWQDLGALVPGPFSSAATAISGDGNVIVGWSSTVLNGNRAMRWVNGIGMQDLGVLAGGTSSNAYAISSDGSVIAGVCQVGSEAVPVLWTEASGMQAMSGIPAGANFSPERMNVDGSVIVGSAFDTASNGNHAMMWTRVGGLVDLNSYLPSLGLNLAGWVLNDAASVSDDGLTIVGYGVHNGVTEAWIVTIPTPGCISAFAVAGLVAFKRRRSV